MGAYKFEVAIFDMDGVITKTARVHADAWKLVFDEQLRIKEKEDNQPFREFTHQDYLTYVDGKPRLKGIQSFLESREINLPLGEPGDLAGVQTIYSIGNTKNEKFREVLNTKGVEVYTPCVELIKKFREMGIKTGVVSSSKNCKFVLEAAGVLDLFDTRVDGVIAEELGLEGKPEGDIFERAATNLGSTAACGIVFEDAISGVQSGRNGGFGLVVGVARSDNVMELNKNGADVTVTTLASLNLAWFEKWFSKTPVSLLDVWSDQARIEQFYADFKDNDDIVINPVYFRTPKEVLTGDKKPIFFLDYDGTLTPIVERPELAVISEKMRETVTSLSKKFTTAIVSGRMREDVKNLAKIEGIVYGGSHGFDIQGVGVSMIQPQAKETIPIVDKVTQGLKENVGKIEGVIIEEKKFSVAVHYRLAADAELAGIQEVVENTVKENPSLRLMHGKKVFEILPAIDWNKGKAVRWIMKTLNVNWEDCNIVYIGDDTTDEDAFREICSRGVAILVSAQPKASSAHFSLEKPDDVEKLFERLLNA